MTDPYDLAPAPDPPPSAIPLATPAAAVATGFVTADSPCRRCGYNLHGLPAGGQCPECGTPVGLSVWGPLLRHADPQWLGRLIKGTTLLFWGDLFELIAETATLFLPHSANKALFPYIRFTVGLLALYASWMLTEPDPSGIGEDQYGTLRKFIRFALITGTVNRLFEALLKTSAPPPAVYLPLAALTALVHLVAVAGAIGMLYYFSKLTTRIPDDKLAKRITFLMYAQGSTGSIASLVTVVAAILAVFGMQLFPRPGAGGSASAVGVAVAFGCGVLILLAAVVVFEIIYLIWLANFKNALRRQLAFARRTWAAISFPSAMEAPPGGLP